MMIRRISSILALLTVLSMPSLGHAAKFANQFVEFELPAQWTCTLEGAEWTCQSTDQNKMRDAIIVLAAKLKGDQDSLDQYLEYLKAPKTFTNAVLNKSITSEPKYAKTVSLNGHAWVDSLHLASELPGFYTRYLATVKSDIGVLVTYSINKDKYQQYLSEFENLVKTLKVFRKTGGINAKPGDSNLFNVSVPANVAESTVFQVQPGAEAEPIKKEPESSMFWLLLLGGALAFIIWRRKRSQG